MLQALLKHKLGRAFGSGCFEPSEDSKTSSVLGLLQYLPAQAMWDLLRQSCGESASLPEKSGELSDIQFWPRWSLENQMELDVFCEFENFNLIVEAKKYDNAGQYDQQWEKYTRAYHEIYGGGGKELVFIALGGNETLVWRKIRFSKGREQRVFCASWQNLLDLAKGKSNYAAGNERRVLSDIILAFEAHGHFCMEWPETLSGYNRTETYDKSQTTITSWKTH